MPALSPDPYRFQELASVLSDFLPALVLWAIGIPAAIATLLAAAYSIALLGGALKSQFRRRGYAIRKVLDPEGASSPGAGANMQARIAAELAYAKSGPRTLTEVNGAEAEMPVPLVPLPDSEKWLQSTMRFLKRGNHLEISVIPLKNDIDTVSAQLRLSTLHGKVLATVRLDQSLEFRSEKLAFERLGTISGAWLAFKLAQHAYPRWHRKARRHPTLLGTRSWESYAMLCHSLRYATTDEEKLNWCDAALREDHLNVGALVEIGRLLCRETQDHTAVRRGIEHLLTAQSLLCNSKEGFGSVFRWKHGGTRIDPLWYQCSYALTVACINSYHARPLSEEPQKHLDLALKCGAMLAQATGATQLTLHHPFMRWSIKGSARREMIALLDREDVDLGSLVAGAQAYRDIRPHPRHSHPTNYQCSAEWAAAGPKEYNPSAGHSRAVWQPDMHDLWLALACLPVFELYEDTQVPDLPPARQLLQAHFFAARSAVKCLQDYRAPLLFKPRYQAACVYVTLGDFTAAVNELRGAFAHASPVAPLNLQESSEEMWRWARTDPALEVLRDTHNPEHAGYSILMKDVAERLGLEME